MAVERQARLHAQGIPRAQTGGLCAQLNEAVPQPGGLAALHIDLIAQGFAGIAGLGNAHGPALEVQGVQGVFHRLGQGLAAGEDLQDFLGLGTLHGNGGPVACDDGHLGVELLDLLVEMDQVLVRIAGVDYQQIPVLLEAVQVGVVHRAAVFIGNNGILGLIQVQSHDVAAQYVLEEWDSLGPLYHNAAHVGHIKDAAGVAGIQVLRHDIRGVLDGHFPPAEIHHCRSCGHMRVK